MKDIALGLIKAMNTERKPKAVKKANGDKVAVVEKRPLVFARANATDLANFDPRTKQCTMNCGAHRDDPRSDKERKLLCDECITVEAPSNNACSQQLEIKSITVKSLNGEKLDPELTLENIIIEIDGVEFSPKKAGCIASRGSHGEIHLTMDKK